MGSSTQTLQSVVDFVSTMAELSPVLPTGGYSTSAALTMATDTMQDLIAQRFNWKWNSFKVPPFYTNSWQQDYMQIGLYGIGWLEHVVAVDINNTALPKPRSWPEAVRDLETTNEVGTPPWQVCWHYNFRLEAKQWPGPGQLYTQPLGAPQIPTNPPTNIQDAKGNLLVLTTYGTTGSAAPVATGANGASGVNFRGPYSSTTGYALYDAVLDLANGTTYFSLSPTVQAGNTPQFSPLIWQPYDGPGGLASPGTTVVDGSCVWTVADPYGQGFRVSPLPPQSGVVYQVNVIAQRKAPAFTSMSQLLNPIPDDFTASFRTGFIAYCHRQSADPNIKKQFPFMRQQWLEAMMETRKQSDRELDAMGFYPDRGAMSPGDNGPVGPANPFNYSYYGWR